jgi:2-dehydropantoate 2-reductase
LLKVCVFGAGAVGGHLAARLIASAAAEVSIVARGEHLRAIRQHGLRLREGGREIVAKPIAATDCAADIPPQDIIFITLKSVSYPDAADAIASLVAPGGHVVCVGNGIQWWWNYGAGRSGGPDKARPTNGLRSDAAPLPLLDPGGRVWNSIGPERALGCVPYSINEASEPGVIAHGGNNRWIVGEPDNAMTERLEATVRLMRAAGLGAEASTDLRRDIWIKLLRNVPLNALCALTRQPIDGLAAEPGLMALLNQIIDEIVAVARAHGWELPADAVMAAREAPLHGGALDGRQRGIKPSMLQDVLAGRAMEVESIAGMPREFAREAGVETPALDAIVPLLRGLSPGPQGPGLR